MDSDNPELIEPVAISAEELWSLDVVRRISSSGTKKKKACRSPLDGSHGVGSLYGRAHPFFHSYSDRFLQVDKMKVQEVIKKGQKPAILDAMALLQKLDENKRGGIDPIGSLERIMVHVERNPQGQPDLYLKFAEFKSRYDVEFKGQGTA